MVTMEEKQRQKVLKKFKNANIENVYVLTSFVGDELEILDPYGGQLQSYGLCYETLRKSIKKLVKIHKLKENKWLLVALRRIELLIQP